MSRGSQLDLLLLCVLTHKAFSQETLKVSKGDNITLPCITEKIQDIRKVIVEWKKNGSYVLVFRSGKPIPAEQDPQFKNRAAVADPELKNGNLSLILRNTQLNDSGVYECRFVKSRKKRAASVPKLITSVTLKVTAEGSSSGHEAGDDQINDGQGHGVLGLIAVGAVVAAVVFVSAAGVFLYKKRKQKPEVDEKVNSEQLDFLSKHRALNEEDTRVTDVPLMFRLMNFRNH